MDLQFCMTGLRNTAAENNGLISPLLPVGRKFAKRAGRRFSAQLSGNLSRVADRRFEGQLMSGGCYNPHAEFGAFRCNASNSRSARLWPFVNKRYTRQA